MSIVEVKIVKNLLVSQYLKSRFCHLQRVVVYYIELDLQEKFLIYQENTVKWNFIIYRIYCNKILEKQI